MKPQIVGTSFINLILNTLFKVYSIPQDFYKLIFNIRNTLQYFEIPISQGPSLLLFNKAFVINCKLFHNIDNNKNILLQMSVCNIDINLSIPYKIGTYITDIKKNCSNCTSSRTGNSISLKDHTNWNLPMDFWHGHLCPLIRPVVIDFMQNMLYYKFNIFLVHRKIEVFYIQNHINMFAFMLY